MPYHACTSRRALMLVDLQSLRHFEHCCKNVEWLQMETFCAFVFVCVHSSLSVVIFVGETFHNRTLWLP